MTLPWMYLLLTKPSKMKTKLLFKEKKHKPFFAFLNQTKLLIAFAFCMFLQTTFAQVTISPWKMNKGRDVLSYSLPNHGNPAAYSQMNIPAPSDPNWTAAPVDGSGAINFSVRSILSKCLQQLDFTYFETSINIPSNFNITDLTISFTAADDGARAYIFNSSHPSGAFIGQISLGSNPVSQNYASLAKAGEVNRLVIVQFDDCPTGNNLKGAQVKVNGVAVPVSAGGCTTSNFFWSNPPTVNGKTATGTINGVAYTYTSSVNVRTTPNVFAHSLFPASFNVPNANPTIQNIEPSSNTLTFASPMTNPVLVFSSIGGGPISVPINFSAPVDVLWSTTAGAGSSFVQNSPTQITGKEAYAIVRMNGTFSSISFDYLTYENYVNFVFGADFSTTTPDTMGPVISLNGNATETINLGTTYTDPGATATDNCSSPTVIVGGTVNTNLAGVYTLTYDATDASGNAATQVTRTVTVVNPIPVVITKNITVNLDASGNATITPQQVDNGSNSVAGLSSLTLDVSTFNCSNIGTNTVTLTATSTLGSTATGTAVVTVVDNIAPTVLTKSITINLDASGNATITPQQIDNGSSDNCGPVTLSLDAGQGNFTCANVGQTNTVTLVITDSHGNTATGTAVVTVQDVTAPTVVTQNITVQLDATGNASIVAADIDNGSNDSCGIASMTLDAGQGQFTCANVGQTNTVTLAVTDVNGNTATGTANVTVVDVTAPTVVTQNVTVQLDATGVASVTGQQFDGGSTDACGVASYALSVPRGGTIDPNNLSCADVGTHNVTLIVTDVNGNAAQATATVTVQDITAPAVVTQNVTVQLDANGTANVTAQQFDGGSTDACGVASYALSVPRGGTIDPNNLSCADVGTHNITLTVTDVNGNAAQATATVTVQDTTAPTMVTQPVTVQLDATGNATITTAMVDNGSYDNCSIVLSLDITTFTCANVGTNTVTLSGTDSSGNVSTATAIVTVQDNIAPTVIAQPITVQLDATGAATITPQMIDNGSSDNCSIAGMTLDLTSFSCENLGPNTVNLTVTDVNGNATTAPAVVTVQDTTAPTMITQDVTVNLDANGAATITAAQIDNGSFDNCSVALSLDITSFGCENVGTNTVTLTGTDPSGNTSSATATVTVVDAIAPTIITQAFSTTITGGVATVTAQDVDGGSYDNCGIQSMSVSPTTFVCGDQGNHTVTLTVTDVSGNVSTGTAIVTILGDVPTISIDTFTAVPTQNTNTVYLGYGPQSMTLNTNTTGGSGFTYSWTSSTGELVSSVANPTISPLVSTTYTVTVTNANGCETTTSIDVCVIDARAIDEDGEYEGKVLVCKGNSDDDDKEYSSKDDDDDDDDDDSHDPKTKEAKAKNVEKFLNKGYTLGACNATCTTTYVDVVVDNDDDNHSSDDHASNDDDKDDDDYADSDDSSDDDKSDNDDDDNNNYSKSGKVKVIIYPNPIVDKVVIGLNTKKKAEGEVKVFDYAGRKIFSKKVKNLKKGVGFNMGRYKSGTYFVRVKYKGKVYTAIIFKER